MTLGSYQRPAYGIYAVRVRLDDDSEYDGVASLGIRPSFEPPVELLEAHLFDFDGDLYGRPIEVALHAYIRAEQRFEDMAALTARMDEDAAKARELLA
jgi:riboflavin kinase/FMN adenylyltransferase